MSGYRGPGPAITEAEPSRVGGRTDQVVWVRRELGTTLGVLVFLSIDVDDQHGGRRSTGQDEWFICNNRMKSHRYNINSDTGSEVEPF